VEFKIRANNYELDRVRILAAAADVTPKPPDGRYKHYVQINELEYPIKQLIHLATGLPYIAFTAQDAYRILTKLGFKVHELQGSDIIKSISAANIESLKFPIILENDEDGFVVASCPTLPGCHSQGRTKEEAITNIKEAIRGYIASMRKLGEPLPVTEVNEVEVAV